MFYLLNYRETTNIFLGSENGIKICIFSIFYKIQTLICFYHCCYICAVGTGKQTDRIFSYCCLDLFLHLSSFRNNIS